MITIERKKELDFYIRNGYPIMITSAKDDEDSEQHFNDDIYTITEMIYENYFKIASYRPSDQVVTFEITEDISLFNGITTTNVTRGQHIDMRIDEESNSEFYNTFLT